MSSLSTLLCNAYGMGFSGLYGAAVTTMQSIMWQDITQVGPFIMQCFARMNASDIEGNVGSFDQP